MRYAAKYPILRNEGKFPLPEFVRTVEWLRREDVTITGNNES